ncbi:hypothetical protein KA005_19610, partial [bacterium]|nr:hypothetical protein [bacterium]
SDLGIESDTYMYLYALDGLLTEITHNDDGGQGPASKIIWNCNLSGSYYIKIRHYSSTSCGPDTHYNISVLEWIPPAEFTDNFNDYGLDNDGNGLFDYLVIKAEINVSQAEELYFSGELNYYNEIDETWDWFGCYAWNHSYLDIGIHTVLLEFNGYTINNLGYNGTFSADISLENNLDQLDYVEYYTNFYNYTDFQEPDTIPPNITDIHVPDYVGLYHPGNLSANMTDNNLQQVSMMLYDSYNITFNQSLVIWYYLDDSGESGTYIVSEYAGTYSNLNQAENSTPASLIMLSNWTQNDKVYVLASFKKNQTASWTQIFLEFNLSNGLLINLAIPSISQLDCITNLIEPGISIVYPFALSLDMGWTVLDSNCNYTLYSIGDPNNPYLSFSPLENGEYAGLIQAQDTEYNMNSTSY